MDPRATESSAPPARPGAAWIYGPWLDLVIGCGAWSAPLLLLSFYFAQSHTRGWTLAFYFLALLFNYPHFMATVYRSYHSRSDFAKYRLYTLHVALLLALTGTVAHLWYPLLPWIFTLYIFWSPWHYSGQNFGLLVMFSRRAGFSLSAFERYAIRFSFIASFLMLLLSFNTGPSGDPLILSLGLPARFTLPVRAALAAFFFVASGWALLSLARRSSLRAIVAPATLVATQFLWFLLPAVIEIASGREVRKHATAAAFSLYCTPRNTSGSPAITSDAKPALLATSVGASGNTLSPCSREASLSSSPVRGL